MFIKCPLFVMLVRDLVVNQSFPHWFKMQYFSMKTQYLYLKMQDFNAQSVGGKKLTEQKEDSKNNKIWDYQFAEPGKFKTPLFLSSSSLLTLLFVCHCFV